VKFETLDISGL